MVDRQIESWLQAKADLQEAEYKERQTRESLVQVLVDERRYDFLQLNARALHRLMRSKQ